MLIPIDLNLQFTQVNRAFCPESAMNEQPHIRQTGLENPTVYGDLFAEINQTAIHLLIPKQSQPIPSDERSGSPNFVGRVQDLRDLHQALQQEDVVAVCAVRGMGGIGKTELAIQYAQSSLAKESYVAYYWFALNRGSLAGQVLDKAMPYLAMPEVVLKSPSLERQVQWCWQNWWPTEGQVLVIIDDVQGLPDIPSNFLPLGSRFKVLLTTRQRNLSPSFRELALGVLSEDESLQLLQRIVDKAGTARVAAEGETAKAICGAVGYLPLALELAATFLLDDPLLRLADYLAQLHLLDESLSDEMVRGITAERGVIAAFTLSWQRLSEEAQGLAMLLGQFGTKEILVDNWLEQTVAVLGWEKAAVVAARKLLTNLSLIEITAERSIALHPLLRQYYRYQAGQRGAAFIAELHWGIFTRGIEIMMANFSDPVKGDFDFSDPAVSERIDLAISKFKERELALYHLEEIEREMEGSIHDFFYQKLANSSFADDSLQVLINFLLAKLEKSQGRFSEVEPIYLELLSTLESYLGADHPDVATSLNNLAELYHSQGRYSEAEPLFLRSLSIRESQLGADHPDVATSLNNLAELYHSQGRYSEAEPLFLRSLSIRESQLGADHLDVATSLFNLATLYNSQGRYSEDEPLYLRSLSIRESQLGADHLLVASSLIILAGLYVSQGRHSEAEPPLLRSLSIKESQLGADHPDVATILECLAGLYYSQGRNSESKSLLLRALTILEKSLGNDHRDTKSCRNKLRCLQQTQTFSTWCQWLILIPLLPFILLRRLLIFVNSCFRLRWLLPYLFRMLWLLLRLLPHLLLHGLPYLFRRLLRWLSHLFRR